MAHMYGMAFEFIFEFLPGCHVFYLTRIPSPKIVLKAFGEIKPVVIISVPLIIEKIIKKNVLPKLQTPSMKVLLKLPFISGRILDKVRQGLVDAFGGRFCHNVIIDHCSISWCTDECASFYANYDFTMQWCIISESLRMSKHPKQAHGYGAIWGGLGASYYHNMIIHHDSRTPRFGTGNVMPLEDHKTDMRNNVIYNWSGNGCYGAEGMYINMVNNYWKPGPATTSSSKNRFIGIDDATPGDGKTSVWGKY